MVFYGHDHKIYEETLKNGTVLINPGEMMGRFGRSTFIEIDLSNLTRKLIDI